MYFLFLNTIILTYFLQNDQMVLRHQIPTYLFSKTDGPRQIIRKEILSGTLSKRDHKAQITMLEDQDTPWEAEVQHQIIQESGNTIKAIMNKFQASNIWVAPKWCNSTSATLTRDKLLLKINYSIRQITNSRLPQITRWTNYSTKKTKKARPCSI